MGSNSFDRIFCEWLCASFPLFLWSFSNVRHAALMGKATWPYVWTKPQSLPCLSGSRATSMSLMSCWTSGTGSAWDPMHPPFGVGCPWARHRWHWWKTRWLHRSCQNEWAKPVLDHDKRWQTNAWYAFLVYRAARTSCYEFYKSFHNAQFFFECWATQTSHARQNLSKKTWSTLWDSPAQP